MSASKVSDSESKDKDSETVDDLNPEKVHSANKWEAVDLGDDDRKKKFLKLMGAAKQEHRGRFVIGDKEPVHAHTRDNKETEEINKHLEEQFKQTFEHRVTRHSHKGLGFADGESNSSSSGLDSKTDKDNDSLEEKQSEKCEKNTSEDVNKKRQHDEAAEKTETPPKKPKMIMNFVKSSDSN
ncbi:small acidic protein-like [Dreissena polymorpha]|uniref:Small acidic protein n=1 Tax=Dreissena polymorpha TaxID=45954 RepID=A0A9D4HPZ3_DREPO|nr:small acidic protein-like [Dreissena polymorpha]KAH3726685.1 hypothetical protein DPMN_052554 [Dreissena polymorpha]